MADTQSRTTREQTFLQTTGTRLIFTEHVTQKPDPLFEHCTALLPMVFTCQVLPGPKMLEEVLAYLLSLLTRFTPMFLHASARAGCAVLQSGEDDHVVLAVRAAGLERCQHIHANAQLTVVSSTSTTNTSRSRSTSTGSSSSNPEMVWCCP